MNLSDLTTASDGDDFQFTVASTYNGSVEVTEARESKEKIDLTKFNPAATDKLETLVLG